MATPTIQIGGTIRISPHPQALNLEQPIMNLSKKIDNLQYSISRLTNLNTVHEKGKFPSQPHQNPKGIHETGEDHQPRRNDKETHASTIPQALHGKKGISNASEILEVLRQVKVNIPLLDMIKQVPTYVKFLKDLCTIKKGLNVSKKNFLIEQVSSIIQCKSPVKYKDPGCPTISVMIGETCVEKALLDLGASVNLLPCSVYKKLGLGDSISSICAINNSIRKKKKDQKSFGDLDEGLPKPSDFLATLPHLKMREEILPLFNRDETQEAAITHGVEVCIPGREQAEPCYYFFISYHYSRGLST
ncbi:hypothetical protein AAG906_025121 [Vitis piasezkii]